METVRKYLNHETSRFVMFLGIVVFAFVMLLYICVPKTWIMVVGWVIFGLSLFQTLIFYRCPYCKHGWDYRTSVPDFCPYCGHVIE